MRSAKEDAINKGQQFVCPSTKLAAGRDMMRGMIHNIPVYWDSSLSWEEIDDLAHDVIQTWAWEGRTLGRIECIGDGQFIHIHAFEKPVITTAVRKQK